jgi:bifunctional UDP-N-acetylglucosamine pyrophosphorylase / glucosamine-1-phosphate N-acetyltransferase
VLAAGQGTRMQSERPKVLQPLAGSTLIDHILDTLQELGFGQMGVPPPVVVVGYQAREVEEVVGRRGTCILQTQQQGTGDAAAVGLRDVGRGVDRVLLIHGDEPLIDASTYEEMLAAQRSTHAGIVLLTGEVQATHGLGRVIRDHDGRIVDLVQEKELTHEQRRSREINFGAYVFDRTFMERGLPLLTVHPGGEYYLTDLIRIAVEEGLSVSSVLAPDPDRQMGVNDRQQLERAEAYLRERNSEKLAESARRGR